MATNTDISRFAELLDLFKDKRVLVVGDIMLDRYVEGEVRRVSPEAPAPVLEDAVERYATGGAGNVAKNLAQLGAHVILMGVVGVDEYAQMVYEAANREGYHPAFLQQDPGVDTTVKTRFVCGPQLLLRHDQDNKKPLPRERVHALMRDLPAALDDVNGVFVSDYGKHTLTRELVRAIMTQADKHHQLVMADVKPKNIEWFRGIHMLSPNADEGRAFIGLRPGEGALQDVVYDVRTRYRVGTVFLTAGDQGMWVSCKQQMHELVAQRHKIDLKDTSGCGDTVAAVILLATLSGATPLEAAELANAAGAVVASKRGAVAPRPDEVLAMLRS